MPVMSTETDSSPAPAASPEKPADKTASSASSETASGSGAGGEAGKSSRESVGGPAAVHYGYFSNTKTPEYRAGWDEIWGGKKPRRTGAAKGRAAPKAGAREPILLSLSLEDLPEQARLLLVETARAKLRKSRLSYDRGAKAGAVSWRIECEVRR